MRKGLGRHNYRSAGSPQPSLVLDFAGTGTLDPRVTFTRSTTARYYNSSGVLTTAAINEARFDYNPSTLAPLGLLIEQSSTNLLTYSQDFSNAAWSKTACSITTAANIAPDGTQTAQLLVESATTNSHFINQLVTKAASAITYTGTYYFKAATRTYSYLQVQDGGGNGATVYFNLTTGAISTVATLVGTGFTSPSATITSVGNGWYRCSLTVTSNSATNIYLYAATSLNGSSTSYTGDGTSGIYIWSAQLEALAFPTSYIPTTSAQVTRAADNANMTGTNFSSWYNQAQGNSFIDYKTEYTTAQTSYMYGFSDGGGSNRFSAFINSSTTAIRTVVTNNNTNYNVTVFGNALNTKYATALQSTTINAVATGTAVSNTTIVLPTVNQLAIGAAYPNVGYLNGWIKKFAYYPIPFTDSQNQALVGS
jgi:hypothetical protein